VTDDRGTFAGDPDPRLARRVVGVAAVLPVPAQTGGVRCIRPLHAAVEQFDTTTVFRTEAIDF